jgi:hypothetical protein
MEIDKLLKVAEGIMEDLGIELEYNEDDISELTTDRLLETTFENTMDLHSDFMMKALGGAPDEVPIDVKKAVFNIMIRLNSIILVQDQMDLPN